MDESRTTHGLRRITPEVIQEAVGILRQAAPGATIIVFGSHARGTAREDSDLDLMVVEDGYESQIDEWMRLRKALKQKKIFPDLILIPRNEFEHWKAVKGSVFHAAVNEGIIYA